ncbi:alpha/beta hydrolase-fold protein [Marinifilum fragile]|uniref:alpha/beta hydrolase-fold protein n=1 Tax=Marinifilum fragile TaxID=570161 RepID=UPI002AA92B92|nr:alpha/beta hydrolase-fold protein [Marinifilum fragile]
MDTKIRITSLSIIALLFFPILSNGQDAKLFVRKDTIYSKVLNETRIIDVYLPPNYFDANDNYPLQIVLGNTSRTQMYYALANYLSQSYQPEHLHELYSIPQSIIVGVGHTNRKNIDNFRKYITTEVIPIISKKYRESHYKTIVGHSVSGELVLHSLLDSDSPFNSFFCSAPANSDFFIKKLRNKEIANNLTTSKRKLFFAAGENDYFNTENRILINKFKELKQKGFSFESTIKPYANHHSVLPMSIIDALFFIYQDWHFTIPEEQTVDATNLLIDHYEKISRKIGFEVQPPEFDFYLLAYLLNIRKAFNEKIKVLKMCKKYYPQAINADAYLARTYYNLGNLQEAKTYNQKALLINTDNEFAKQTKELIDKHR